MRESESERKVESRAEKGRGNVKQKGKRKRCGQNEQNERKFETRVSCDLFIYLPKVNRLRYTGRQ